MPLLPQIQPSPVHIRHIKPGVATDPGAVQVLGRWFRPDRRGVNGDNGFAGGTIEPRLCEEGTLTVKFPNTGGEDGALHRDRFQILRNGKCTPLGGNVLFYQGGAYRPGDEWIEVWLGEAPTGDLLMVGTPTQATLSPSEISLNLQDAQFLTRKTRSTAADFWNHPPRDVFEHYSGVWTSVVADGFDTNQRPFTYGTSMVTSTDGVFNYNRAYSDYSLYPGTVALVPGAASARSEIKTVTALNVGTTGSDQNWRIETTLRGKDQVYACGLSTDPNFVYMIVYATGAVSCFTLDVGSQQAKLPIANNAGPWPGILQLAIEGRGRWVFFYVNNSLICVMPMPQGTASKNPQVFCDATTDGVGTLLVESLLVRKLQPFLMRGAAKGDYTLPGAQVPNGFNVDWFQTTDLLVKYAGSQVNMALAAMNPTHVPLATGQQLPTLNFPTTLNTIRPNGIKGSQSALRATGSMNLDLANYDYRFRVTAVAQNVKLAVGRANPLSAFLINQLFTNSTDSTATVVISAWLKSGAGLPALSGWVPFLLEQIGGPPVSGSALTLEYQRSDEASTTWTVLNADSRVQVSQYGAFKKNVRFESHYDQHQALKDQFGIQWRMEPRSLESGLFPGEMVPQVRTGRDTAKVVDSIEATDIQDQINAEGVADALIVDGSGVTDPNQRATVIAEGINFAEVGNHLLVHQEYESLSDISDPMLLAQRAQSLLALRGAPWEEVNAKPRGYRELVDRFPLTGALAEFKWQPGDGVRLALPEVGVVDVMPRQVMSVQRAFMPDGIGPPTVGFRQSPRGFAEMLRRMAKASVSSDRNYQGQLVTLMGTLGAMNGTTGGGVGANDAYSRVVLPESLQAIVGAWLTIQEKGDTSTWVLNIDGGATPLNITFPGRYDVFALMKGTQYTQGTRRSYANLSGGTSYVSYQLELLVRT